MNRTQGPAKGEVDRALAKLVEEVHKGLRHGFFDYRLSCEIVNGKKRRFTIGAGMSHNFVISEEDLTD